MRNPKAAGATLKQVPFTSAGAALPQHPSPADTLQVHPFLLLSWQRPLFAGGQTGAVKLVLAGQLLSSSARGSSAKQESMLLVQVGSLWLFLFFLFSGISFPFFILCPNCSLGFQPLRFTPSPSSSPPQFSCLHVWLHPFPSVSHPNTKRDSALSFPGTRTPWHKY